MSGKFVTGYVSQTGGKKSYRLNLGLQITFDNVSVDWWKVYHKSE